MSEPIKEVYEKFKHMDKLFSDPVVMDGTDPYHLTLVELWGAIKAHLGTRPAIDAGEIEKATNGWYYSDKCFYWADDADDLIKDFAKAIAEHLNGGGA